MIMLVSQEMILAQTGILIQRQMLFFSGKEL